MKDKKFNSDRKSSWCSFVFKQRMLEGCSISGCQIKSVDDLTLKLFSRVPLQVVRNKLTASLDWTNISFWTTLMPFPKRHCHIMFAQVLPICNFARTVSCVILLAYPKLPELPIFRHH